ncbi:hypothetical protein H4W33_007662 [Kibdelosporangium phytohabitans]|nr:hypothetical protein [Kibdelosporangium phytohabitans]MBE1468588.1 hypothetical protein [Kibdelosporangium phytohabitans]
MSTLSIATTAAAERGNATPTRSPGRKPCSATSTEAIASVSRASPA